ncbi:putative plasmid replication initiator protein [Mycobacterium kansasii]|uniref:Putative plasmid replication initiator protein n=1 Tax=Mycobacterium kansasii TaxID=1768 RepID=A0A1V3WKG6_MYCKA|nr:putative plasmid replication initiator protein [Mycobacterium kansasii]OOK77637.1 putative plasmid replication initiator protein [Mycobacterium kansasii]
MNSVDYLGQLALPGVPDTVDTAKVVEQMVRRASSMGFESWWRRAESVGFCAHPIQLVGADEYRRDRVVWTRCNNRRAHICPSCSDLYARDTWQLVHAGAAGGHHGMPITVADRPQVFLTLTAPATGPFMRPHAVATASAACVGIITASVAIAAALMENRCGAAPSMIMAKAVSVSRSVASATTTSGMCCSPGTYLNCGAASPSPCDAPYTKN